MGLERRSATTAWLGSCRQLSILDWAIHRSARRVPLTAICGDSVIHELPVGQKKGHFSFLAVDHDHVWQKFKAFPIEQDDQLLVVLRHIERNPVRAGWWRGRETGRDRVCVNGLRERPLALFNRPEWLHEDCPSG